MCVNSMLMAAEQFNSVGCVLIRKCTFHSQEGIISKLKDYQAYVGKLCVCVCTYMFIRVSG